MLRMVHIDLVDLQVLLMSRCISPFLLTVSAASCSTAAMPRTVQTESFLLTPSRPRLVLSVGASMM